MNIPISQYLDLLRAYLQPQRSRVLLLACLLLASVGLQLLNPQVIRRFIDTVQAGGALHALIQIALLFLLVVLIQRTLALATTYVSQQVAWRATNGLRCDLARHVLKLDMGFHNAHTPGELLERIDGDVDHLANFFSEFLLQIITGLLLAVGVLLFLWREDGRIALALAFFVVLYLIIHTRGQQLATPYWAAERQSSADLMGFVEERLAGVRDLQSSGAITYTLRRFYELVRHNTWQKFKADVVTDVGWTISKIFYDLGTATGMALGAYLFYQGAISLGTVYLIIHYLGLLNGPLNSIARQLEDLQQARVAIARVRGLFQTQSQVRDQGHRTLPTGRALRVRFDNATFGYQADAPVLRAISFALAPGQTLGVIGRTASGKTTLTRLLFRLYALQTGQIYVDEQPIDQLRLTDLRQRIGLVTQEVQIFPGSLRDNLTLFNAAISDQQIWESLRQLDLVEWVQKQPGGLDLRLTADGSTLSAGEAQLLALARIFLKDPGLVILDEASSRLDPATERLLERALDSLLAARTVIIIAHRLTTVRRADAILLLEQGAIKEFGPYQQLAADPHSTFASLLRMSQLHPDQQSIDELAGAASEPEAHTPATPLTYSALQEVPA